MLKKTKNSLMNKAVTDLSSNLSLGKNKKMSNHEISLRSRSLFDLLKDKNISSLDFRDALIYRLQDIKNYGLSSVLSTHVLLSSMYIVYIYVYILLCVFIFLRNFILNSYSFYDIIFLSCSLLSYLLFLYFKLSKEIQIVFPYLKFLYFDKLRLLSK